MDKTTRVNIGQRAHSYVLHALAYWPTFADYSPLGEEAAAAKLGLSVETLQRLREGELDVLPELNRRVRRTIGSLSVGHGADVVDYYLPTNLPRDGEEAGEGQGSSS